MIINIPIQIDDKITEEKIQQDVEKQVVDEIMHLVIEHLKREGRHSYGSSEETAGMKMIIERVAERKLDEYRDQIINFAGGYLADKLSRTKKAKELLEKLDLDDKNKIDFCMNLIRSEQ